MRCAPKPLSVAVPASALLADGFEGRLCISATDWARDALYDFVRTTCTLSTG